MVNIENKRLISYIIKENLNYYIISSIIEFKEENNKNFLVYLDKEEKDKLEVNLNNLLNYSSLIEKEKYIFLEVEKYLLEEFKVVDINLIENLDLNFLENIILEIVENNIF